MTGMIRINPAFVLLSCFFLAIYLMIGSVEDWGDFQTDWGIYGSSFSSRCGLRIGVFLNLDCTLIVMHQEGYQ